MTRRADLLLRLALIPGLLGLGYRVFGQTASSTSSLLTQSSQASGPDQPQASSPRQPDKSDPSADKKSAEKARTGAAADLEQVNQDQASQEASQDQAGQEKASH